MHDVAAPAERIEAEAFAHLLLALPSELKARIGLDDATLSAVCAEYTSVGVPRWMVQWSPEARPRDERDLFARHGGHPKAPTAKMWGSPGDARLSSSHPTLRVEEIGRAHAEFFQTVVAPALGMLAIVAPLTSCAIGDVQWHHYVVFDGDTPIAGAAMFVQDRGAYFGLAATAPEARGRGAQSLLLARRMVDAKKLGCEWVTASTAPDTESQPNPSYRNMLRAGMRLLYHQPKYLFGSPPVNVR